MSTQQLRDLLMENVSHQGNLETFSHKQTFTHIVSKFPKSALTKQKKS